MPCEREMPHWHPVYSYRVSSQLAIYMLSIYKFNASLRTGFLNDVTESDRHEIYQHLFFQESGSHSWTLVLLRLRNPTLHLCSLEVYIKSFILLKRYSCSSKKCKQILYIIPMKDKRKRAGAGRQSLQTTLQVWCLWKENVKRDDWVEKTQTAVYLWQSFCQAVQELSGNCRRGVPHWRETSRLAPSSIIVLQLFGKRSPANGCQLNAPLAVGCKGLSWREIPVMPLHHDMPISLIVYLSVFWLFLVEVSLNLSLIASLWVAWYHQSFYSIYVFYQTTQDWMRSDIQFPQIC